MLLPGLPCSAQEKFVWHNPSTAGFSTVHNQLWKGQEIKSFYDRLPARAEHLVRKVVWALSENAAGLKLIFNTDAKQIIVRYVVAEKRYAMDHFPATGVSGLDLFMENTDGSWSWSYGKYSFQDTITYTYTVLPPDKEKPQPGGSFHLYLPLYNSVEWLEIGIPEGNTFEFVPVSSEKPIVVYGTSIAQGGCVSRAGLAWTNILNRDLHIPIVNLGFSGNGRLEKEVVDLIVEKEARIFILDCMPNMGVDGIRPGLINTVNTIRSRHPETPVILVDHSSTFGNRISSSLLASSWAINDASLSTYKELQKQGIKNLYYLRHEDIGLDMNDTVDEIHPTDIGMLKYAKAYKELIQRILKKNR